MKTLSGLGLAALWISHGDPRGVPGLWYDPLMPPSGSMWTWTVTDTDAAEKVYAACLTERGYAVTPKE